MTAPRPVEYMILIDANSAMGDFFLSTRGKIGGATGAQLVKGIEHPVIIATEIEWGMAPGFVRMIQIRDPGAPAPLPREIVVPAAIVLGAIPAEPTATQPAAEQQKPPSPLH